jgi:hypothetical protein
MSKHHHSRPTSSGKKTRIALIGSVVAAAGIALTVFASLANASVRSDQETLGGVTEYYAIDYNAAVCAVQSNFTGFQITDDDARWSRSTTAWGTPLGHRVLGESGTDCNTGASANVGGDLGDFNICYGCRGSTTLWTPDYIQPEPGWPYVQGAGAFIVGGCVRGKVTQNGNFYGDVTGYAPIFGSPGCLNP